MVQRQHLFSRSASMPGFFLRRTFYCALSLTLGWLGLASVQAQFAAAAEEAVPAAVKKAPATHKQSLVVKVADPSKREKLEDFCLDSQGRILALIGQAEAAELGIEPFSEEDEEDAPKPKRTARKPAAKPAKVECQVRVYGADGKLADQWSVGFTGQAINTAPDGTIVIGGDGYVARFDASGKKLHEAESPQMTYIRENGDEMRERAKEQLASDIETYTQQVKQFEDQLKEIQAAKKEEKKDNKNGKKGNARGEEEDVDEQSEQLNAQQLSLYVQSYKSMLDRVKKQTVDQVLQQVLSRAKKTHSITAGEKDVFVSCPAMAGYGFGVWRTDEKFGNAKEIIKSLSGCCGQMDVQCCEGELYVCENSRHRVVRFDRDGKEVGQFGKRDRTGEGENFGGCCNPMNLCFNKQGNLYVSESNGVVKHFTTAGKYLGIVGVANVQPGCKNSCVGVTADDDRLCYIDVQKSAIIVLARIEDAKAEAKGEAKDK
jgi:hypothetical protein